MKKVIMPITNKWFDIICSRKNRPYVIVELKKTIIEIGREKPGADKDETYYILKLEKILE